MTSKPALSKKPSATSVLLIKPQCKIHSTAVVSDKAQITGSHIVEIGENCVIHPYAKLNADFGNVVIGKGCIIAEKAVVGVSEASGETDCIIGDSVSIETGAVVEAKKVGDHSTIEVNSKIGAGAIVGKWCKVAPLCQVKEKEVLEDLTVVFGEGHECRRFDVVVRDRKEVKDAKMKGRAMELEVLRGLIPDGSVKWTS